MFADLIRQFCDSYEEYGVCENYSGRGMFGALCMGIVVKRGYSYMTMMYQLTKFLDDNEFEDASLEMEGVATDELGLDTIVYFPHMRDYEYKAKAE
jgi:hypothetical protein